MAKDTSKKKTGIGEYFKGVKVEMKKVVWPTSKQMVNNVTAVITIVLLTAAIVFVLDVIFDMGNKYGISNLQNIVNEKYNSEEEKTDNTDNGEESTDGEENLEEENTATEETTAEETDTTEPNAEDASTTDETTTDGEQTNPEQ